MNEAQFYQKLKKNLPMVHWMRIENSIGSGMFDINACYQGTEFWVELKEVYTIGVLLRPSQHAWAFQRAKAGSKLFVLGFEQHGPMYIYKPPFTVEPYRRWLKVISPPCYKTSNWKTLLEIFLSVQSPSNLDTV